MLVTAQIALTLMLLVGAGLLIQTLERLDDWVFASPDSLLKRCIRPAAVRAKITKHIGWHTFRRTFTTLLKDNGADVKVMQELLQHATVKMTLEVYA